ncbi:cell division protein SepF [Cyanobium sp. CH-040]|uniref:cell division protein SepF n=1 Tax=Cyanobium sp. CH-040 TaxID=2823708 RepID=UPI0020CEB114|nr:cell division protein SepF [Cyanobium sp. CH-040]MCP9926945.1 cell division protein SepF [Cyanobium sp. CH-040]
MNSSFTAFPVPVPGVAPSQPWAGSSPAVGGGSQVLVFTPRSLNDARTVIAAVRANRTVVVNSAWLEDSPGQRLIDFVCGGIQAICGQVHRIAEEVFLFAPAGTRVQASQAMRMEA